MRTSLISRMSTKQGEREKYKVHSSQHTCTTVCHAISQATPLNLEERATSLKLQKSLIRMCIKLNNDVMSISAI